MTTPTEDTLLERYRQWWDSFPWYVRFWRWLAWNTYGYFWWYLEFMRRHGERPCQHCLGTGRADEET